MSDVLDLAVVGAGAAGTYLAWHVQRIHAEWSIALFERTDRIGGRLRSLQVDGLDHPIELGGMRFMSSHRRVTETSATFGLATHAFDDNGGAEKSFLRGQFAAGADDPAAGVGYDLPYDERGQSAVGLLVKAFERIVPGARTLTADDWAGLRRSSVYRGRPLIDWSVADALASVLSPEGRRFVTDAFGYDSGLRVLNLGDAIEYLLGAGDPSAEARVPNEGMQAIPQALAGAFRDAGGRVCLARDLEAVGLADGLLELRFANGEQIAARRVVLALPVPALGLLADASPLMDSSAFRRTLASVEAFPAVKLYLWYDRPWWRDHGEAIRLTTDLPPRKLFYFGRDPDRPAALLAAYTDGQDTQPWFEAAAGERSVDSPAPQAMLDTASRYLREIHPRVDPLPEPLGSAFSAWGVDPHETGWHYWRPGFRSDDVIAAAVQPVDGVALYICGEAFSRAQAWVEGALESADRVVARLTGC